ncbi:MAG: leucine-rich repeat domain-containing protein [Muribaculaceae bacterium]
MTIRIIALIMASMAAVCAAALEVVPGMLGRSLAGERDIAELVISGRIDARDIAFMADSLSALRRLDMSDVVVEAFTAEGTPLFANEVDYPANTIPSMAFANSAIAEIVLPQGATAIGEGAFAGCRALVDIDIPSSLATIADYAFFDCSALTAVSTTASEVGSFAFARCTALLSYSNPMQSTIAPHTFEGCEALTSVCLPAVSVISAGAFAGCTALADFRFPQGLTSIGDDAFKGTALRSVDLSACRLESVGEWAFADCTALTDVCLPGSLALIGSGAFFADSKLASVTLPDGLADVSDFLLTGCSAAESITLPQQVTTIGKYAFAELTSLIALSLPASVERIDDHALDSATSLQKLASMAVAVPSLGDEVFRGIDSRNVPLTVPDELIEAYRNADQWKKFSIVGLSGVELPGDEAGISAYFEGTLLQLHAHKPMARVVLYDIAGRCVCLSEAIGTSHSIDISHLGASLYVVAVAMADGSIYSLKMYRQ